MKNTIKQTAQKIITICEKRNEIKVKMALVKHECAWAKCNIDKVIDLLDLEGIEVID